MVLLHAGRCLLASELPAKSRGSPVPSPSSQLKGSLTLSRLDVPVPLWPGNTPMLFTKLCHILKNGKIRFSVSFLVSVELSSQED